MHTKQLMYFVTTAEHGSMAGAARELDIAQPAITQQIAKLEHELDCILFERGFRGVRLTESGEAFLISARSILNKVDDAKKELKESKENPSGIVRVGMSQSNCNLLAVPLITKIEKDYPNIELDIQTGLSYNLHDWLQTSVIDVAVSSLDHSDLSSFELTLLVREQLFLVMSKQLKNDADLDLLKHDSIKFDQLAGRDILSTNNKDSLGYCIEQYEEKTGVFLNTVMAYGQLMTTLRYVVEGHAMTIGSSASIYHLEGLNQLHNLAIIEPRVFRDVFLMTLKNRPSSYAIQAVSKVLKDISEEAKSTGRWKEI